MTSLVAKPALHVVAIGGRHQYAHFIPVACKVLQRGQAMVKIFVPTRDDREPIEQLARGLGLPVPEIVPMSLPPVTERHLPRALEKIARLLVWARRLCAGDAILCAERTTTLLKRLPGRCPPMLHFRHGAGDRAVGFEKRIGLFDSVFVAGSKDRTRLIADGIVEPEKCLIAGPIKLAAMAHHRDRALRLFDDDRPVILYNPHFEPRLNSLEMARPMIADIVADGRFNLIVAPHVRLAKNWDAERRASWHELSVPHRVVVDLGSDRSIDMSYTLAADAYLGDVSSQVYEFLAHPRPCIFANAHGVDWMNDPNYAMWHFGEVISSGDAIVPALERAFRDHDRYLPAQRAAARSAFEGLDWGEDGLPCFEGEPPIDRAANAVDRLLAVWSVSRAA